MESDRKLEPIKLKNIGYFYYLVHRHMLILQFFVMEIKQNGNYLKKSMSENVIQ
jgi:hypothetical protein